MRPRASTAPARRRRAAGFTLAELVVAAGVMAVILIGVLNLFDFTSKVSRIQLQLAEMQQGQRIAHQELVRMVRMAGRGGLADAPPLDQSEIRLFEDVRPVHLAPGFELRDNVADDERITDAGSPLVVPGTDVLTIRGVFSTPVYVVDYFNPSSYSWDPATNSGTIFVPEITSDGRRQDLSILIAARARNDEAIILVSALNDQIYGVARLDDDATADTVNPTSIRLSFDLTGIKGPLYNGLSGPGAFPGFQLDPAPAPPFTPPIQKVAYLGLLEEYRYYVRHDLRDGELWPKLSRARVYPNTQAAYRANAAALQDDLVEGIFDFQVALGYDSSEGGSFLDDADNLDDDDRILEVASGIDDDWLFNGDQDDPEAIPWSPPGATREWDADDPRPRHYFVRLTSLLRTERRDLGYQAPLLARIENHTIVGAEINGPGGRQYRRQLLQSLVDLRNAG